MTNNFGSAIITKPDATKVTHGSQIIAITSGKGGVGKSMLSVNMSILFQKMRKKVLLIDADVHLGNVDLLMGVRAKYTLSDVLNPGISLNDIIVKGPGNVDILPASSTSVHLIGMEEHILELLADKFAKLHHTYDYIIIDTGSGISKTVISFLLGAEKIIVIVSPDPASIVDGYAMIKVIKTIKSEIPVIVIANMVNSHDEADIMYKKIDLMVQKFLKSEIEFGGSILKDELVSRSIKKQRPFVLEHPYAQSTNALQMCTRKLLNIDPSITIGSQNLFKRLITNRKTDYQWSDSL